MKLGFVVLISIALIGKGESADPKVNVTEGILVGEMVRFSESTYINKTVDVDVFLGIPYADPPERFAKPVSKTPWTGERNATEFAPACLQVNNTEIPYMSEDCLYLNVYSPSNKSSAVPVMVWIHGGGIRTGTAMTYDFYGVPLAAVGDVIIVTVNYRLSIFGQFTTMDDVAPGNFAMLDQVAALEWVYNNIEAFGGDKDQITLFGQSAGAACVNLLLLSKLSRPYISKIIMQSGTSLTNWAFRDDPELERELAREVGEAMECNTSTSELLVSCLRTKDPLQLREVGDRIHSDRYPVILDGVFLQESPRSMYNKGDFPDVPILVGSNKDKAALFVYFAYPSYAGAEEHPHLNRTVFDEILQNTLAWVEMDDAIIVDATTHEYVDWTVADDPLADYFRSIVDVSGDMDFGCPTDLVVREHAEAGYPVFQYFMTHQPTKSYFQYGDIVPSTPWLGATHSEDLTFVWGIPFIDELYHIKGHNMTADENALSVKFMEFWTNFAKSGNPSKPSMDSDPWEGQYAWPEYTIPDLTYKEMTVGLPTGRAVRARQCHFWNQYIPSLAAFTDDISDTEKEWREIYDDWKTEMTAWQQAFEEYKNEPTCN
ncbi:cholinesterase-like [Diadema antillarum]|uniref:cholinesterase-like n=1 Tax=Diadema antillarum TaxID=105358 RepID=UPI003A86A21C